MDNDKKTHNEDGTFAKGNKIGNRFSSENQPQNKGRKGKAITEYLKELGESDEVKFSMTITNANGQEVTKKGSIKAGDHQTVNELIAVRMLADAVKGDHKARKEVLDRTEGRAASFIDITSDGKAITLTQEERESKIAKILSKMVKK